MGHRYFGSKATSGVVPSADCADATAQRVHRDALGRGRGHEAQAGGAAQHRHRPGRTRRWRGSCASIRWSWCRGAVTSIWPDSRSTVRNWSTATRRTCAARASPRAATATTTPTPTTRRAAGAVAGVALRGDGVGLPLGAVRGAAARVAQRVGAGDEPGGGGHREGVVELRARPRALGHATRGATSRTARRSNARRRAGAGATKPCRRRSAWRCWPPSWRWRRG